METTAGKVQRIRGSAISRASVSHTLLPRMRGPLKKTDHKSHRPWITTMKYFFFRIHRAAVHMIS